jgi:hypothetical protein
MARILPITYTYDNLRNKRSLLGSFAQHWIAAGHEVGVVAGLGDWPDADISVMHVDFSVIPDACSEAARRYPQFINGEATDIRKRRVSRNLVLPGDDWSGLIVIKTDLNYRGIPELHASESARRDNRPADYPAGPIVSTDRLYPILPSSKDVPDEVWANPGLVVERFLPEQDTQGYWPRAWVFCARRWFGRNPVEHGFHRKRVFRACRAIFVGGKRLIERPCPRMHGRLGRRSRGLAFEPRLRVPCDGQPYAARNDLAGAASAGPMPGIPSAR